MIAWKNKAFQPDLLGSCSSRELPICDITRVDHDISWGFRDISWADA
jgi:hypothetical protein